MPVAIYLTHTGLLPYSKFLDQPTLGLVIAGLGVLSAIGWDVIYWQAVIYLWLCLTAWIS